MLPENQSQSANNTDTTLTEQPGPDYQWTDDDVAAMSLSGCLSTIVLTLVWMLIFLRGESLPEFVAHNSNTEEAAWMMIGTMAASVVALVGSAYVFGIRRHPRGWGAIDLRPTTRRWLLSAALIGLLFIPANIAISMTVQRLLGIANEWPTRSAGKVFPVTEFLAVLVMTSVIVPIGEEIFFRGIIYRWLRGRAGLLMALAISSVTFGALHLAPASIVTISILGVFLALVYEGSGSLWPSIMIHSINNAVIIILSYVLFYSPILI